MTEVPRRKTIEDFKWGSTQGRMVRRILRKLGEGDPQNPFRRAGMSEAAEVYFKALVHPLGLLVRQRVVSGAHA